MNAWEIGDGFGLDQLRPVERPEEPPGSGEVALELRAVSLNFRDLLMVQGAYDPRQPLPLIPCSDAVAVVRSVGPGVTRVAPGDRVCPIFAQRWIGGAPSRERLRTTLGGPLDGTLRRGMVLPAEGLVHVPEHLSDTEAATLPCAAVTAWNALVTHGPVRCGETVLVQGTGGVALFALQFAKMLGARVIVTSSSHEKLERARALGADLGIHYGEEPNWGRNARRFAGEGVDHVLELGGGATFGQSLDAVRIGGRIVSIGVLSGRSADFEVTPIFMKQLRIQGIVVGHRDSFEEMNRALEQSTLRPIVDRVFAFEEADRAFAHLEAGAHFGKVAIEVAGTDC